MPPPVPLVELLGNLGTQLQPFLCRDANDKRLLIGIRRDCCARGPILTEQQEIRAMVRQSEARGLLQVVAPIEGHPILNRLRHLTNLALKLSLKRLFLERGTVRNKS